MNTINKRKILMLIYHILLFPISIFCEESLEKGIHTLSQKLQVTSKTNDNPKVAILGFSTVNNSTNFENYINGLFYEDFFNTGKMQIIERSNIDVILNEQKFQTSGNVDDNTAKSIGRITGVDYVCYGNVIQFDNEIIISGRIVNIETGQIEAVASTSITMTRDIQNMLNTKYDNQDNIITIQKKHDDYKYRYKSAIRLGYGLGPENTWARILAYKYNITDRFYIEGNIIGTQRQYDFSTGEQEFDFLFGGLVGIGIQTNADNRFQLFSTLYAGYGWENIWRNNFV